MSSKHTYDPNRESTDLSLEDPKPNNAIHDLQNEINDLKPKMFQHLADQDRVYSQLQQGINELGAKTWKWNNNSKIMIKSEHELLRDIRMLVYMSNRYDHSVDLKRDAE